MKASDYFDYTLISELNVSSLPVRNISELIFNKIEHRDENADIILSHDDNILVTISLKRLRHIVFNLYQRFKKKEIKTGDTVLLASISGNNELFISLLFLAMSSYGVKVLLPMYMETNDLYSWLEKTACNSVVIPGKEIFMLTHHDKEKSIIDTIKEITKSKGINCYDIFEDFNLPELVNNLISEVDYLKSPIIIDTINNTNHETEAMLITTSGSVGKSKIVIYNQGSFIKSCLSWCQAGFFDIDKLGGRGFTPLFTHTMGIRAFFNAIWTGVPVCLIKTEWFEEKPETVRYFLIRMKPQHITGGPSVFNLLLEIIRNFPELKIALKSSIKTLISSGAPIDRNTVDAIESSFGLTIFNAFGTTETQQALSTLLYENASENELNSLGLPLPGITIGLKKLNNNDQLYRMFIKSEFGMKRNLDSRVNDNETPKGFFNTGDVVELVEKNIIRFIGREKSDFFKDGFGVKVSLHAIKNQYKKLHLATKHVEYYPLKCSPGIAVLVFIKDHKLPEGFVTDRITVNRFSSLIDSLNIHLNKSLEPFEYRHCLVKRFAIVNAEFPKTIKGNPSSFVIKTLYQDTIKKLVDTLLYDGTINELKSKYGYTNSFTKYHNPHIGHLLSALCIDKTYHRGQKDSVYFYENGKEIEVLDIAGGYGSNLLGHNNEDIKNTVVSFLKHDEIAISDQGSIQKYVGLLADYLNLMISKVTGQRFNVLFASTGSEAVEIALHHALFAWRKKVEELEQIQYQRYGAAASSLLKQVWESNKEIISNIQVHVIAIKKSFHGNTTGSRSLSANSKKRGIFENILSISPVFIDDTSKKWRVKLEKDLNTKTVQLQEIVYKGNEYVSREFNLSTIIAAIAEPIIGEGGIRQTNPEVLNYLSKCSFPLIMDEIQCGLGRSGSIPSANKIKAEYYLFGKSLGGNVEKISAILIDYNFFKTEFGEYYSSTFANGGLAAKVALKTLSIINEENVPEKSNIQGEKIRKKLNFIKEKYPNVISEISGSGLMQGIGFNDWSDDASVFLRNLYNQEYCGLLFSSYLLNEHNIRIFPTLSAPNILRIEPSAFITDFEIDRFSKAIEDLADKIDKRQFYELFAPLMDNDPFDDNKGKIPEDGFMETTLEKPQKGSVKVAMIAHFAYPTEELRILEKEFCKASDTGLRILFNRLQLLLQMKPFVLIQKNLYHGKIHFSFILIPVDSAELERLNKQNKRRKIVRKIQEAADMAGKMGVKVLSLGAYTSILSNNGLALVEPENTKIVTGNTLTAASGIHRLIEQIKVNDIFNGKNTLGVVGASGNIGSIITMGLLESEILFKKAYLIGRNRNKLSNTLKEIERSVCPENQPKIEITTKLSLLKNCNIIIVASNTNDPIINGHHINRKTPVIISDLSIPAAISKEVTLLKNIINIPFASYIDLPEDPEFKVSSHTPRGAVFCCLAEAILYGLEPIDIRLKGKITKNGINSIIKLADKYGFFDNMGEVRTYKSSH